MERAVPVVDDVISVTSELAAALVNVTAAVLVVPELQPDDKAPLHVPFVTVFPAVAPAARLANPAATAVSAILPLAARVRPSTVTVCPEVKD